MNKLTIAAALVTAVSGIAFASPPQQDAGDALIPRSILFGNPVASAAEISPDGAHVSWLAPVAGVMNLWVAPAANPAGAKPVTRDAGQGIRSYVWAPDSRHLLYLQDAGGNENTHLYSVDTRTAVIRDLTPGEGLRAQIEGRSSLRPDVVLVGINDRDPQFPDLYEIDYRTGEKQLILQNPGVALWIADHRLAPRFATRAKPNGATAYLRREADGSWREAFEASPENSLTMGVLGFDRTGNTLYLTDSRNHDSAALVALDTATLRTRLIASGDKADVNDVLMDPRTFEPIAYSVNYLRREWTGLTPLMRDHLAFLRSRLPGEIGITSMTDDGGKAIVTNHASDKPSVAWLYDLGKRSLTKLYESQPALARYRLRPMIPAVVRSSDGMNLVSYLTLPAAADPDGDGKANRPVPLVLHVHGGPWLRDSYGYNPTHQWLADRGYAVLGVNMRGSLGFGKAHLNAATHEFAGKMHQDLLDAVDWAVAQGVTTQDQVAIMGLSYGGYATLVGLTFTPDRFKCGVDLAGMSNLATLIESFEPYWRPFMQTSWYRIAGDPANPEDRARLLRQSPISRIDSIRSPLLIGQALNDPRVKKVESDRVVAAMKARNLPVTYAYYTDEGHGFVRPQNKMSFNAITEAFLSKCLGGRYEPVGDDFAGSTVQVLEGASHVPGLAEALTKRGASAAER